MRKKGRTADPAAGLCCAWNIPAADLSLTPSWVVGGRSTHSSLSCAPSPSFPVLLNSLSVFVSFRPSVPCCPPCPQLALCLTRPSLLASPLLARSPSSIALLPPPSSALIPSLPRSSASHRSLLPHPSPSPSPLARARCRLRDDDGEMVRDDDHRVAPRQLRHLHLMRASLIHGLGALHHPLPCALLSHSLSFSHCSLPFSLYFLTDSGVISRSLPELHPSPRSLPIFLLPSHFLFSRLPFLSRERVVLSTIS